MKALDGLCSPQLRFLKQRLQDGDETALSTFWESLASKGNRIVRDLLKSHGYNLTYHEYPGDMIYCGVQLLL